MHQSLKFGKSLQGKTSYPVDKVFLSLRFGIIDWCSAGDELQQYNAESVNIGLVVHLPIHEVLGRQIPARTTILSGQKFSQNFQSGGNPNRHRRIVTGSTYPNVPKMSSHSMCDAFLGAHFARPKSDNCARSNMITSELLNLNLQLPAITLSIPEFLAAFFLA